MSADNITRPAYPTQNPGGGYEFRTFRMGFMAFWGDAQKMGLVAKIQGATGLQIDMATSSLNVSYLAPIPIGRWERAKQPRHFHRMPDAKVDFTVLPFQTGFAEDLRRLMSPGPLVSAFNRPNLTRQMGNGASALVDKCIADKLLAGDTGVHGYFGGPFFKAGQLSVPSDPDSQQWDNKVTITLDPTNTEPFIKEVKRRMTLVPHPAYTPNAPQWIAQELGALLVSPNRFDQLETVWKKDRITTVVAFPDGTYGALEKSNTVNGTFELIKVNTFPDDRAIALAKGPGADSAILVHSLAGVEGLPGGDFMSPVEWRQRTGSWMMPRIWELGPETEHAKKHSEVLIGGDLDTDCGLYFPPSAMMIVIDDP